MRHVVLWNPRRSAALTLRCLLLAGALCVSVAATAFATDAPPAAGESAAAIWQRLGLPSYQPPAAYSEDLVINAEGKTFTMKRAIDGTKMRTDMTVEGHNVIMIEMGDEPGTTYMLMPDRKEAIKQSRAALDEMSGGKMGQAQAKASAGDTGSVEPTDVKVEDLGDETVNGAVARKMRLSSGGDVVLAWFDKTTGGPLRMESTSDGKTATIDWENRKAGPQAPALFEVPKNYKLNDMDEMVAQMKSMGNMGGMAQKMMAGMAQGMGPNMGVQLGTMLGGSFGGALGAMAGEYIGGRVGNAIGGAAAERVGH